MDLQDENWDELPKWLYHVMEEVDEECVCFLRQKDRQYQEIREEMKNMERKFPIIKKMFDEHTAVNLSAAEHKIILDYLQLQLKMELREKTLFYWIGHVHCYVYLKKLGALL